MLSIVAIPADEHCFSTIGLIPPRQWALDDGGYYDPSEAQKKVLWAQWEEGWQRVRELRGRFYKGRLIVIQNGDAVEGTHDKVMAVVNRRREAQEACFTKSFDWALKKAGFGKSKNDQLYFTRGTEWHVGRGAESDERLAKDFEAIPEFPGTSANDYEDARYSHYHLKLDVDDVLLDVAHHGPKPGTRAWTKENGFYYALKSLYFDSLDKGYRLPRAVVRSHYHRWIEPPTYNGTQASITGFLTPAFQLTTPFGLKMSKAFDVASIGLLILIIEDGNLKWECPRVEYEKPILKA